MQGYLNMDLLRLTTAGSVDDGKSTLIGRLLYDTKSIFQDQYEAIEATSKKRGESYVNLALLTDGLKAEREQNITIDVAYRYFATPKRKFIIADTPGHIEYTRNMVTGASTAELAIILIDARKGVLSQSKRHGFISSLLQIPHIIVAINKMDLVNYDQNTYQAITDSYREFAQKLDVDDITFIPISALNGDNVVHKSEKMPWYNGSTLLHKLETVKVGADRNMIDFRFPVQYVIRPHQDYRGFAGQVASGSIRVGEEVIVLPSRVSTKIKSIDTADGPLEKAIAKDSVVLTTEDEVGISRGDMIVRKHNLAAVTNELEAYLCWMDRQPMQTDKNYIIRHTSRETQAFVNKLFYKINVDTLHREKALELGVNEIGRVSLTTAQSLFTDPYKINRETGSFILIDPATNVTVGAGMIRHVSKQEKGLSHTKKSRELKSSNVVWEGWNIQREAREAKNKHKAAVVWFTGLSASGKSSIAALVEKKLFELGCQSMLLDGDNLRHGLNADLGFSDLDRFENIRRVAYLSQLFFQQGTITISTFISPFKKDREFARKLIANDRFIEVFVDCPVKECIKRDPKGLYDKALKGEIENFTGISSPYEAPQQAELHIKTTETNIEEAADRVIRYLKRKKIIS